MSINMLAAFAEFEADLIRMRTCEGTALARARPAEGQAAQAVRASAEGTAPDARQRRLQHQRPDRTVLGAAADGLSDAQAAVRSAWSSLSHERTGHCRLIGERRFSLLQQLVKSGERARLSRLRA